MLADKLCHHLVLLVHGLGARVNVAQFGLVFFNLVIDFLIMNIKRDFDVDERANQFPVFRIQSVISFVHLLLQRLWGHLLLHLLLLAAVGVLHLRVLVLVLLLLRLTVSSLLLLLGLLLPPRLVLLRLLRLPRWRILLHHRLQLLHHVNQISLLPVP